MDLSDIKGVGPEYLKKLNGLDIFNPSDLVNFLPSGYIDLRRFTPADGIAAGDYIFVAAAVGRTGFNRQRATFKADLTIIDDGGGVIKDFFGAPVAAQNKGLPLNAFWFNRPYIKNSLRQGRQYAFFGKATDFNGVLTLTNPIFEPLGEQKTLKGILPIYKTKGLIPQGIFRKFMQNALEYCKFESVLEYSADDSIANPDVSLYKRIHAPTDIDEAYAAQRRLAEEDFVRLILAYKLLKADPSKGRAAPYSADGGVMKGFFSSLPFAFTPSQEAAFRDITSDLKSGSYMNRLLLGDVGSGKTAVALAAAYFAAESGAQCAFLAPTELLARQHYDTALELLGGSGLSIDFLSGSVSRKQRAEVLDALACGRTDIIIGTHSVFSRDVAYSKLALVIIDEQHRFGVKEKSELAAKSAAADILTLSATPIPRAISLALLGELDVSKIERRSPIDLMISTKIVPDAKRGDMFGYIRGKIKEGGQAYIVAPRIEDAEGVETDAAEPLFAELKAGAFADINAAVLHGRTSKAEREKIMSAFKSGEIGALVATTVIEVGIDVKNAGIIAVMNAERYGLATLHQLRGRVGRGDMRSYCFLHTAKDADNPRLRLLTECADGFKIAEKDFDMRGGGSFLGENQSGSFESLNNYIIGVDKDLIIRAKALAETVPINGETAAAFGNMNYRRYYNIIKNTVMS
ncbi:MAG: ATP-dependent DNA helicase RecG [Clostridiales bacterium]|jgi:ATP-dependent DNA helicase RecG|nr:ATP-dependent DNA helicase RecG [Clostridiales bacterium]